MIVAAILGWAAAFGGGVAALGMARRRSALDDLRGENPEPALGPAIRGTAQILYASTDDLGTHVDCVLVGDDAEGARRGSLLTLHLAEPERGFGAPAGTSLDALLHHWADAGALVALVLEPLADGWLVLMDDKAVELRLEVRDPARV